MPLHHIFGPSHHSFHPSHHFFEYGGRRRGRKENKMPMKNGERRRGRKGREGGGTAELPTPLSSPWRAALLSAPLPPLSLFILDLPEGRTPTAMAPFPEGTVAAARLPPSLPLPLTPALRGEGTEKEDDGGGATLSLNPGGGSATSKGDGSPAPLSPLIVFSSLLLPSNRGSGASVGSGQEAASCVLATHRPTCAAELGHGAVLVPRRPLLDANTVVVHLLSSPRPTPHCYCQPARLQQELQPCRLRALTQLT